MGPLPAMENKKEKCTWAMMELNYIGGYIKGALTLLYRDLI
jgi:hypothetical protein